MDCLLTLKTCSEYSITTTFYFGFFSFDYTAVPRLSFIFCVPSHSTGLSKSLDQQQQQQQKIAEQYKKQVLTGLKREKIKLLAE